jgi:flavodoxin I
LNHLQQQNCCGEETHAAGSIDFTGKTVALFALGDQVGYSNHFVSSMRYFWDKVRERGGQIVGLWPTEGYEFTHSDAVVDEGCFAGLAISISHT